MGSWRAPTSTPCARSPRRQGPRSSTREASARSPIWRRSPASGWTTWAGSSWDARSMRSASASPRRRRLFLLLAQLQVDALSVRDRGARGHALGEDLLLLALLFRLLDLADRA